MNPVRKTVSTDPGNTKIKGTISHAQVEALDHGDPKFDPRRKPKAGAPMALPLRKLRTKR